MQIVGIPGNCAEAGFSPTRPSARKEAAKQDTHKKNWQYPTFITGEEKYL